MLFLQGKELGTQPVHITRAIIADEVITEGCDRAVLNGDEVSINMLPQTLAAISSDVCRLILTGWETSSEFTLDFRIASEEDLQGMEEQFERTARGRHLDTRAIEEFISATSRYGSAIGYCDGICSYLYGALAKERAPDSSLSYESYVGKYSKAAEELSGYDRPLARMIRSLIEFHFNHFEDAARLGGERRVGQAAGRYVTWLQGLPQDTEQKGGSIEALSESLVTDWETEQIVRWSVQPFPQLLRYADNMESFLNRGIAEYDKLKLHVLLGEVYRASGDVEAAIRHAKIFRNVSALERWAESMIGTHFSGS
jgi:hypothetical protein